MKWKGVTEFVADMGELTEELRVEAARGNFEMAKKTRDYALQGMSDWRIGLVTGRSRALYAAKPGASAFMRGGAPIAYAGYTAWPADIEFYPEFLNNGTRRMSAKPYHDGAVERIGPEWEARMQEALRRAGGTR